MSSINASNAGALTPSGSASPIAATEGTNLADVLERVLDKGVVIAGDIKINLLDIELLTIKLRLIIASVETAKAMGLRWWETDPWLASGAADDEPRLLAERVKRLEQREHERDSTSSNAPDE
jgi:Gas vesicle protein